MNILVTGANGQLGSEIKELSSQLKGNSFTFVDLDSLDITLQKEVDHFFSSKNFDYCINCAAYTAVDKSEENLELATRVNVMGVENLSNICQKNNVTLIHISTDFVFEGIKNKPYSEEDPTNPVNVYGKTKLEGEKSVQRILKNFFIIRTSWLYSAYGNNFVKTMLRLAEERDSLGVVVDQVGTPTYAKDLAKVILKIIESKNDDFGLYHYSNEGVASWYDFAHAIFDISGVEIDLTPILTHQFPLPAPRPVYTVLSKEKIKKHLQITVPHWRDSLKECLKQIHNKNN